MVFEDGKLIELAKGCIQRRVSVRALLRAVCSAHGVKLKDERHGGLVGKRKRSGRGVFKALFHHVSRGDEINRENVWITSLWVENRNRCHIKMLIWNGNYLTGASDVC